MQKTCWSLKQKAVAAGSIMLKTVRLPLFVARWVINLGTKTKISQIAGPFPQWVYWMCSPDLRRWMGLLLDISLHRVLWWVESTVNEFSKNPLWIQTKTQAKKLLKYLHAESDSNNDSDQTIFPKFIVLESTEDTLTTKLFPFTYKKKNPLTVW